MGRALDVKYNPRSNRWEIPFKKRDLGYFKTLTETLAEVSTDLNEEQEEANKDEITLQQEDK
jgi:hypothetical protein